MAKLKATTRNKLPNSAFGLPKQRKYPMEDRTHEIKPEELPPRKSTRASCHRLRRRGSERRPSGSWGNKCILDPFERRFLLHHSSLRSETMGFEESDH
jgi:hypothetical protein